MFMMLYMFNILNCIKIKHMHSFKTLKNDIMRTFRNL